MAREKEWALAMAREVAEAIPDAVRQVPNLRLTKAQIAALQRAFQNRLIQTMGKKGETAARAKARS
jgi:hypothetical protein